MRDGDVGAEDAFVIAQLSDNARETGAVHLAKDVLAINAQRLEGRVLHRRRETAGDGIAQEEDGGGHGPHPPLPQRRREIVGSGFMG